MGNHHSLVQYRRACGQPISRVQNEHSTIPWIKIAGLRHRLVHHYEDTNWTVICAIIYDFLPKFLNELIQL